MSSSFSVTAYSVNCSVNVIIGTRIAIIAAIMPLFSLVGATDAQSRSPNSLMASAF